MVGKKLVGGELMLSQGFELPWGYGLAYQRWDCNKAVCYPLGINWLVWICREVYFRIKFTPRGIEHSSYTKGREMGYSYGFGHGYKQGRWDEQHEPKGVVYKNNGNDVGLKYDE